MTNILVTAVGSELAFSVIKAIQQFSIKPTLIGCDIYEEVVGKYWVNEFYQVPLAREEDEYVSALKEIVKKHKVRILIPTADIEYFILPKYKDVFREEYNCEILVNEFPEIERFNDKWKAFLWYKEKSIPTSHTVLPEEYSADVIQFPCIIKPRTGGGSRHIYKLKSKEDLKLYSKIVPQPVIQEYLYPDDEEYTAGTYRTIENEVFSIILKRTLKFGMTNTAEVIQDKSLQEFAKSTILKTNLIGSNNIQFRLTNQGPKVLEINPRFSGTTGIRAKFGFNDVEMWVKEIKEKSNILQPVIKNGYVLRFMEEQYHLD